METLEVPKFATEAEEADWWYDIREILTDHFIQAAKEGRLGYGTAKRRFLSPTPAKINE